MDAWGEVPQAWHHRRELAVGKKTLTLSYKVKLPVLPHTCGGPLRLPKVCHTCL